MSYYVPCTQVDIGLAACVDTRPSTPSLVGFVYLFSILLRKYVIFACIERLFDILLCKKVK